MIETTLVFPSVIYLAEFVCLLEGINGIKTTKPTTIVLTGYLSTEQISIAEEVYGASVQNMKVTL
ncbi:MAG TPA: hypothetical protein VM888_14625 [Chitinophagaceae bacterium]|jgi:hypothetical protein|nr:hypothetical protein [Chitinophagaceae bacterium]